MTPKKPKLYSSLRGDKGDPNVVLLHGLLGAARNLTRLADAIANAGFYVLSYDQRGHGRSEHMENYSLPVMAEDLFSMMAENEMQKAHLVGHSMGARVCLTAAGMHPEKVLSLCMLDAGTLVDADALSELRGITAPLPDFYPDKESAEAALSHHNPGMRQFLITNLKESSRGREWVFDLKGIREQLMNAIKTDQTATWKKLKMPLLSVRGGNSTHFYGEEQNKMLTANTHAKAVVVPNAGHWLHVDNFDATAKAVVEFLESNK